MHRTRYLVLALALLLGLGSFFAGRRDARSGDNLIVSLFGVEHPVSRALFTSEDLERWQGIELGASLAGQDFRQGEAPDLVIDLNIKRGEIPPDVTRYLRLHLTQPDGYDPGRPLIYPDELSLSVSNDGRRMRIVVPLWAFASQSDQLFKSFAFGSPGQHSLHISLVLPDSSGQSASVTPVIISSPIPINVLSPSDLETVSLPTPPMHFVGILSHG